MSDYEPAREERGRGGNVFERAIERGEIALGEYATPLTDPAQLAAFILDAENFSLEFCIMRGWFEHKRATGGLAVKHLYDMAKCDALRAACPSFDWTVRVAFAGKVVDAAVLLLGRVDEQESHDEDSDETYGSLGWAA